MQKKKQAIQRVGHDAFIAKGTRCDSPGQRPGKMRIECFKPRRNKNRINKLPKSPQRREPCCGLHRFSNQRLIDLKSI